MELDKDLTQEDIDNLINDVEIVSPSLLVAGDEVILSKMILSLKRRYRAQFDASVDSNQTRIVLNHYTLVARLYRKTGIGIPRIKAFFTWLNGKLIGGLV